MQHRKHDVDRSQDLSGVALTESDQRACASRIGAQRECGTGLVHRRQYSITNRQRIRITGAEHPGTVGGDPHRDHLVGIGVQIREHATRRDTGHRVLTAAATEDDGNFDSGSTHGDKPYRRLPANADSPCSCTRRERDLTRA